MISSNTPDSGVAAGPGCGAQRASLHCVRCGHQRGWLSNEIAKFLSDVIEHFGRPIAPVRVRMPQTTPELRPPTGARRQPFRTSVRKNRRTNAGTSTEEKIMKNLAIAQADDGWGDAAAENSERVIKGTRLKFNDRHWTKGKEGTEVEKGTALAALSTTAALVKWANGKPIEYRMRQPGGRLPEREELGDLDECQWEVGPDGNPKDPWQNTRFVYLVDPTTAEAYTFSTSSWGGRQAVADLADQIQRMRCGRPGAVPIVELDVAPMPTKFGIKSKPFFKVIDWHGGEPRAIDPPGGEPGNGGPTPALVGNKTTTSTVTSKALDDEVPF